MKGARRRTDALSGAGNGKVDAMDLTGKDLTIEDVVRVARMGERVEPLGEAMRRQMEAGRQFVKRALTGEGATLYGVNTGFGPLAKVRIANEQARKLSRNVILACVTGVGPALSEDVVRAMMFIRAAMFARGASGVRPLVAETLIDMLNTGVTPLVPCKGSLGASGDLAPLAHIAAVMTTDTEGDEGGYSGQAWFRGDPMSGAEAMERAGIGRFAPEAKEGLSLINGTTFMVAAGALAVHDARNLLAHAVLASALSLESSAARKEAFHPAIHRVGNQPGQIKVAEDLLALVSESGLMDSRPENIQDAYSLRCIPQVLGPISDALGFVAGRFADALNSVSDNPLVFAGGEHGIDGGAVFSGGNFHGQGPAMWLDFLGIAMAEAGSIAERRIFRLLTPELSNGLPAMLIRSSGLDTGLMMPQYTAAALVSDNKTLAHPDSVDSIPSSGNQEDHVSMGANAARHAAEILDNLRSIIAIEFLTAAQAVDLRPEGPARLGKGTAPVHARLRETVRTLQSDRELTPDIEAIAALMQTDELLDLARQAVGSDLFLSR